jgi:cell wall-associated NlpC family hydrolase
MTQKWAVWPLLILVILPGALAGCASRQPRILVLPPRADATAESPAPAEPSVPLPSPEAATAAAAGSAIVRTAETVLGTPYRDGGALPDGFDCSGLVTYVFARNGIAVPRDVRRQAAAGIEIERAAILPGDLLFFSTTGAGPTHVGIAVGGDRFIHAPKSGAVVRVESLASAYWSAHLVAVRRLPY